MQTAHIHAVAKQAIASEQPRGHPDTSSAPEPNAHQTMHSPISLPPIQEELQSSGGPVSSMGSSRQSSVVPGSPRPLAPAVSPSKQAESGMIEQLCSPRGASGYIQSHALEIPGRLSTSSSPMKPCCKRSSSIKPHWPSSPCGIPNPARSSPLPAHAVFSHSHGRAAPSSAFCRHTWHYGSCATAPLRLTAAAARASAEQDLSNTNDAGAHFRLGLAGQQHLDALARVQLPDLCGESMKQHCVQIKLGDSSSGTSSSTGSGTVTPEEAPAASPGGPYIADQDAAAAPRHPNPAAEREGTSQRAENDSAPVSPTGEHYSAPLGVLRRRPSDELTRLREDSAPGRSPSHLQRHGIKNPAAAVAAVPLQRQLSFQAPKGGERLHHDAASHLRWSCGTVRRGLAPSAAHALERRA
jgi:hypothetical protein